MPYTRAVASTNDDTTVPRPSALAPRFSPGDTILHYRVLEPLGKGGMGEVYLVRDVKLQRDVAAKFLPLNLAADTEAVARFEREAVAAARVTHQNVVRIYSIERNGSEPFITAEYIRGTDLSTSIRQGPLSIDAVGSLVSAIAAGLAAAHAEAVVHRDIKPQNIRVRPDGTPVIVDFGLGKLLAVGATDSTQPLVTRANELVGTINYMSPEPS